MSTAFGEYSRSGQAILSVTDPADFCGVAACLATGSNALAGGDHELAGAMLDEAAARAGIIDHAKLARLHQERLAGAR